MAPLPLIMTVNEVVEALGIDRPKIYDLLKGNVLSGFKVGADWRVRRDSVERLGGFAVPAELFVERSERAAA